jgi:hypothetical protein
MSKLLIEAGMCLWEEVHGRITDDNFPDWVQAREAVGTAAMRSCCADMVEQLEADWVLAQERGYDDSFDWEFVPVWVNLNVEFDPVNGLKLKADRQLPTA